METTTVSTVSPSLLQIPPQIRYRIYQVAFRDTRFVFSTRDVCNKSHASPQSVAFKTSNFPFRMTEVCHRLHDEVAEYMAYNLNAKLVVDTGVHQFALQDFIPGRYLARVWQLLTSYTVMEQNKFFNIEFLPGLKSMKVHIGTILVERELNSLNDFGISKQTSKHRSVGRYVAQCFSDFDGCKTRIEYCREYSISSTICFRACVGNEERVHEVQDVEVRNSCGDQQELRVTKQKFRSSRTFEGSSVGEVWRQGKLSLARRSLLKHEKLLCEVLSASERRTRN